MDAAGRRIKPIVWPRSTAWERADKTGVENMKACARGMAVRTTPQFQKARGKYKNTLKSQWFQRIFTRKYSSLVPMAFEKMQVPPEGKTKCEPNKTGCVWKEGAAQCARFDF
jgi:hypothetical protein